MREMAGDGENYLQRLKTPTPVHFGPVFVFDVPVAVDFVGGVVATVAVSFGLAVSLYSFSNFLPASTVMSSSCD